MNRAVKHRDFAVTTRARAGLAVHATASLALIPAFLLLAPASDWTNPGLLAVLAVLAVIAVRHDVPLPSGIAFDATVALALVAVALVGPLAAFAVIFPPIVVNALSGREHLLRAGNLANFAAYGWYTLAGGLVLAAANVGARLDGRLPRALRHGLRAARRQLRGRAAGLRHDVAGPSAAQRRADVPGRTSRRRGHDHARRAHGRALRARRAARPRRLRPRRGAAAERAHVRGADAAGRAARPAHRHAPLRARDCACSSPSPAPSAGSSTTSSGPRTRAASPAIRPSTSATRSWTGARRRAPRAT